MPDLNPNLLGNEQIQEVLCIFLSLFFGRRQCRPGFDVSSNKLPLGSVPDLGLLEYSTCPVLPYRVVVMGKVVDFEASNGSCFGVLNGRHDGLPYEPCVWLGNWLVERESFGG